MSSRPKIVILDAFAADQGDAASFWSGLRELGDLVVHDRTANDAVVERCRGAFAALTNKVPFRAVDFAALPELRYVGVLATGTNIIDIGAARERGIAVTNVPGYATESVAELVFAQILHFSHGVVAHDVAVKRGAWASSPDFCFLLRPLTELAGKTLALVGSGAIGGAVARIAEAFRMHVIRAAVPGAPPHPDGARVPLRAALPQADFVSLHCPLTDSTRGLVDGEFLAALKPGAILINTGRGPLIDEDALLAGLTTGRLGGVALDVLSAEPPPANHPLLDPNAPFASRVVVTPHIGWATVEARQRLAVEVTDNLRTFLAGQRRNRVD